MQLLRAVLVTTSIADWTPCLDPIRATLQSLECLDAAETLVVADALPSEREAEALSPLDGDKWRQLYEEKAEAYDTYLNDLQTLCDARPATTLLRQATFGHLVGSVRAGFNNLKCAADDVVLITQHDLALLRAPPVFSCGKSTSASVILRIIAETFVNLHAVEPPQLQGQHRVDGVGRPKFDFHIGRGRLRVTPRGRRGLRASFPRRRRRAALRRLVLPLSTRL